MFKLVVLSSVLAFAAASWIGMGRTLDHSFVISVFGARNYRGPLSLAPGQPANILAADGRPLDTLSVNMDRAAHLTARAISGAHLLKKRSVPLLTSAPLVAPTLPIGPLAAPARAAP
ncbi:hypothetical protein ACJJTC_014881 [Scirpophaga incertulas]